MCNVLLLIQLGSFDVLVYIPNRKVYTINLLPFLCFFSLSLSLSLCRHLAMLLLQLEFFFPLGVFCLAYIATPGSPLLTVPPLTSAVSRCKARGYKPLSLSFQKEWLFSRNCAKGMCCTLWNLRENMFFLFLQDVSFVISLFCAWDSDICSVLAVCFFVH
jgi:hypothetical protein